MISATLFASSAILGVLTTAVTDPVGDAGGGAADISAVEASGQGNQLRVFVHAGSDEGLAITQVLIDTDLDAGTGHQAASIGADLLIEGQSLYRFAGDDPAQWTWEPAGNVALTIKDNTLTARVPGDLLGSDRVSLVVRTLDSGYAVLDQAPDDAGLLVSIKPAEKATEALGDTDDKPRDIESVTSLQDGGAVTLTVTAAAAFDFATTLIFFDADGNAATGFAPSADPGCGFEYMLSGGTLSRHVGNDRSAWTWESVGQADLAVSGRSLRVTFNPALIGTDVLRFAVWNMSADWQSPVDIAPDHGLYELKLDADAVEPMKAAPTIEFAPAKANADLPSRQRVAESDSFYCYYGSGKAAELSHYDVVILHSPQMELDNIAALNERGVVTIGYISVGEDDTFREGDASGPGGMASWYFDRDGDGAADRNGIWNSWYANAADPKWRADRVAEAKRLVEVEGYDGIFLDTLDTAQIYPDSADGMVQLVAELRDAIPDSPIILNQGFKLFDRLAPMADGLMLESFTATFDFQSKQYMLNYDASIDAHTRNVRRNLLPVLETHPMPIFVLDYAKADDTEAIQTAADRAATFGFQFAAAPIYLDEVYINGIVGTPDPKWLQMQATPESMSLVLAEPANGFPAGTKLVPSSCFAGYSVAALVDGVQDRSTLHWTQAAWASSETQEQTWLAIELPEARSGGVLGITWAIDSGLTHTSLDYTVEVRRGDAWVKVGEAEGVQNVAVSTHALHDEPYTGIRLVQPSDGGSVHRPEIMWVGQLSLDAI